MAAIADLPVGPGPLWPALAQAAARALGERGIAMRDAVVLLPYAALLPPARDAFAAVAGWLPRIETPLTLAASLAPPPPRLAGAPCGDAVLDRLHAAALLRQQPWGAARERADARGFAHVVAAVAEAADSVRRTALQQPPEQRAAFFATARAALPAAAGPGAFEGLLLQVALEWAAQGGAAATDVLFAQRPAAWIVVRLGGRDGLAEALPEATGVPGLLLDADAAPPAGAAVQRWVCDGLEQEAQAAASAVIDALNAGRTPVALVAIDRVLVRRVRALLERQAVPLRDETGWTLSTTRAAARLMALLRAAAPAAGADARLDWLKGWPPALAAPAELQALEAAARGGWPLREASARALAAHADAHLQRLATPRVQPLAAWLGLLGDMLAGDGTLAQLRADAAGEQVLRVLRLLAPEPGWPLATDRVLFDLAAFTAWVDATLESAQFVPPAQAGAEVVLTPLARAIGRPFAHVVVPGADERHLGAIEPAAALVGEALAQALGLDSAAGQRQRQRAAFAQLLRAPALTLLRRRLDGDEPLSASPEVLWQALAAAQRGAPWPDEQPWQADRRDVLPATRPRPAPVAAHALPERLSASTVEALRQCPYRFFARAVLRLREPDELEVGLEKRDYGTWLHAVLHRFHRDGGTDALALQAAADAATAELALDSAELLPYRASFETFAPAYLAWLARRSAAGWQWREGEAEREAAPDVLQPQRLQGRLDRLDTGADGALQLIDYKTGSASALKARVADPLEDTQLPFYAALEPRTRSAIYLALDDAQAPLEIEHPDVTTTAHVLIDGLAGELQRLRGGAALPALGEGAVCDTCEARGLCRRDHWTPA